MGAQPEWYPLFVAAPRLGVSVPAAALLDITWIEWALMALDAEGQAREIRQQRTFGN